MNCFMRGISYRLLYSDDVFIYKIFECFLLSCQFDLEISLEWLLNVKNDKFRVITNKNV